MKGSKPCCTPISSTKLDHSGLLLSNFTYYRSICYVIPTSQRASLTPYVVTVPTIDLGRLKQGPDERALVIGEVRTACRQLGFFHIVNHGIRQTVLDEALSSATEFFKLPVSEKAKFMSNDVHSPVRYGTSLKDGLDKVQFWRVFLKHYAHPLADWIKYWPNNPSNYRETMGKYCSEVKKLSMEITEAITESLGIGPTYISKKMEDGMQVITVNCYPPCPNPEIALGLPPHSDYSCLTILLQSGPGLELMHTGDNKWKQVPQLHGALQVHVGDHFEVLSNGLYKSVVHRATLNRDRTRICIASLHSLGLEEKMGTAKELVSEENPGRYKESSFNDFLNFLDNNGLAEGKSFSNTLKVDENK
ncbi:2'-deoxymugineic-acid 2'-dioxygenase [Pyrus ussuriensis x Pyrus communis]|uniref:2'-deoxymugineic-acid 2'-dioxygenase n=1 Tax=Pyrus ussuriensis x Pyrus communis TaxID=2448454 RepID=A0A5N5FDG6_9ROSA|nr:2'-deoxymugineic-acid 2'-dioxygenase [Pyrus ussuriensis x Pyrus communis]